MKKLTASALIIVLCLLAIIPAFASPACCCPGCTGVMSIIRRENDHPTPDGASWAEYIPHVWDSATQRYRTAYYHFYSYERDVYRVCNRNQNHKEFLYTEWYTKPVFQCFVD